MDGNYTIKCPANATLVFYNISYITKEEKVNGRTKIDVTLEEDADWPTFPGGVLLLSQLALPISDIFAINLKYFELA